jgi:hypothetical protein
MSCWRTGLGDDGDLYHPYHCVTRQMLLDALAELDVNVHALFLGAFKGAFCCLHDIWRYLHRWEGLQGHGEIRVSLIASLLSAVPRWGRVSRREKGTGREGCGENRLGERAGVGCGGLETHVPHVAD